MTPLRDQLEVRVKLDRPDHADGFAGAMDHPIRPRPRIRLAIDVDEMFVAQRVPTGSGAVDDGLGKNRRLLRAGNEDNGEAANRCGAKTPGKESVHIHSRSRLSWLTCASQSTLLARHVKRKRFSTGYRTPGSAASTEAMVFMRVDWRVVGFVQPPSHSSRCCATNSSSFKCGYARYTRSISSRWPGLRDSFGSRHQRPSSKP